MSFLPKIQLFPFCLSLPQEYLHLFVKLHKIKVYTCMCIPIYPEIKLKKFPKKNLLATIITAIKKVNTLDQLTLYTLT